jgi:S1-C subfamily serine protease
LPYLKIAEEANPDVGEYVLAIGTPLQLQFKHSVTKGIVSALNRTVKVTENGLTTAMQSLIQHDASINPGNSGGPLINENSKVIGINTLKIEMAEGIGFAIPASVIKNVLSNVLSDGAYQTAYLGVFGYDASIPYFNNKVSKSNGYYVIDVFEGSPANLAGIKKGDVILSVNEVDVNNMIDFQRELFAYKENDTIKIKYMQGDNVKTVEVTLQAKQQHTSTKLKGNSELPEGSLIEAEQLTSI